MYGLYHEKEQWKSFACLFPGPAHIWFLVLRFSLTCLRVRAGACRHGKHIVFVTVFRFCGFLFIKISWDAIMLSWHAIMCAGMLSWYHGTPWWHVVCCACRHGMLACHHGMLVCQHRPTIKNNVWHSAKEVLVQPNKLKINMVKPFDQLVSRLTKSDSRKLICHQFIMEKYMEICP